MAEKLAIRHNATVFRTNFFCLDKKGDSSIKEFIKKSKRNNSCYLFGDVYFNPLRSKTIANIIAKIISKDNLKPGLYNLGSKNRISKSEFYILIFKMLKENINYNIVKVNSYLSTKRSKNMVMSVNKFEKKFQIILPKLKNELIKEVKELW